MDALNSDDTEAKEKRLQFDPLPKSMNRKLGNDVRMPHPHQVPEEDEEDEEDAEEEEKDTLLNQEDTKDMNDNVHRQSAASSPFKRRPIIANNFPYPFPNRSTSKEEQFSTYTRRQSVFDRMMDPIWRHRKSISGEKKRARLVSKDGDSCITNQNISEKKQKFLMDMFTTLLDLKWRYTILVFSMAFLLSWLIFATIYYIICIIHEDHKHIDDPDWKPCHCNVYDFTTAFLFSLETQHTIGYGFRGMEPNCVPSMITLAAQSCTGVFFQCIVTGLVFAKLSRPKNRSQTIMFSEKAVICQRDDELHLLFRVGDMRKAHIIATGIRAIMVKNRMTKEGELIPLCQYPIQLQTETSPRGDNYLFLMWPVTVGHKIDKASPLWKISARQLAVQHFEIVIILEGTVATTGMTTQVRTSYLPSEILWGHRLAPLLTHKRETGGYSIDHEQFHETVPLYTTAQCSAEDLASHRMKMTKDSEANEDLHSDFTTIADAIVRPQGALNRFKNSFKRRRHSELPFLQQTSAPNSPKVAPRAPTKIKIRDSRPEAIISVV